jgi:hypothetical protein
MTESLHNKISNLSFDKLIDLFTKDYYNFYGEYRTEEIFNKIEKSKKIQNYIKSRTCTSPPGANEIVKILHTMPFFIFSGSEAKCIASLHILLMWENSYNKGSQTLDNNTLVKICSDIILKTLKGKVFFEELFNYVFYSKLTEA